MKWSCAASAFAPWMLACLGLGGCTFLVDPDRHPQASALVASTVQLSVDPAYAGQSITATASPAAREDGQVPTHVFAWELLDGVACPGGQGLYQGAMLPSEATCADQRWQVTATPRLSERFVGPPTTRTVQVRPLPGAPLVTFQPDPPYETQAVIVQTEQDPPDPAIMHRCEWTLTTPVDGCEADKTYTGCILPQEETCANEDWQVVVTPFVAGNLEGTPATKALNGILPLPAEEPQLYFSPYLDVLDIVVEAESPPLEGVDANHAYNWTLIDAPCTPADPIDKYFGSTLESSHTCAGQQWRVDVQPTYPAIPPIPGRKAFQIIEIEAAPPESMVLFLVNFVVAGEANATQSVLGVLEPASPAFWGTQNWQVDVAYRWEENAPCSGNCTVLPQQALPQTFTTVGDEFTFTATQCFKDSRTGICHARDPFSGSIPIINEPATLKIAGLSLYQPRVDDTIRAYAAGYEDPIEGDDPVPGDPYRKASYRWLINGVPVNPAVCGGVATEGGDLCDLRAIDPAPGSMLTVRALPYDGFSENDAGAIELGPYPLQPATIAWRKRGPSLRSGEFATTFDPTHERFLIMENDGSLWEWTKALGFVELHPSGSAPAFKADKLPAHVRAVYDGERKLMLWVGVDVSDLMILYSLDVSQRGKERWQRIDAMTPPGPVCLSAVSIEPQQTQLLLYGGLWPCQWTFEPDGRIDAWQGAASNQIHVVDYTAATPIWAQRGTIFSSGKRLFGATAVPHPDPMLPEHVLLFGGVTTTNSNPTFNREQSDPSVILDMDLAYSGGLPNPNSNSIGGTRLPGRQLGAVAISRDGKVFGGLGYSASVGDSSEPFWSWDPSDPGTITTVAAGDFDPASAYVRFGSASFEAAVFGAAGVIDGEMILHLGELFDTALGPADSFERFRLAQRSDGILGQDTWRVAYSSAREQPVPLDSLAAGVDGDRVMFGGAILTPLTGHWGAYNTKLQRWEKLCDGGVACPVDYQVQNLDTTVQASGGGFYVVGGTNGAGTYQSMRPRRFHNGAWTTLGPSTGCPGANCPPTRGGAKLFETGCPGQRFAAYGFILESGSFGRDVWTYDGNGWDLAAPWDGVTAMAAAGDIGFDGRRYVVQLPHLFSPTHGSTLVLDACPSTGTPGWAGDVTLATPGGQPTLRHFLRSFLPRVWDDQPTFLYPSGDGSVWLLRETGDKAYEWEPRNDVDSSHIATGAVLWDAPRRRVLNFGSDAFALWELLVPESEVQ